MWKKGTIEWNDTTCALVSLAMKVIAWKECKLQKIILTDLYIIYSWREARWKRQFILSTDPLSTCAQNLICEQYEVKAIISS